MEYRNNKFQSDIDMHTHTYYSDGLLSPTALVQEAHKRGIKILAITDHDGLSGLEEGRREADKRGIRFIYGVEFSAQMQLYDGEWAYMHLLGYHFCPKNKPLQEGLERIRRGRKRRNEKLLMTLEELGLSISKKDLEIYKGQDYIGKPNFARALVERGYAATVAEAFSSKQMMAAPKVKAIHREKINAREALSLIRDAGGFSVLAHPMKVTYKGKDLDSKEQFLHRLKEIVQTLCTIGLSGIECYYGLHSEEETEILLGLAKDLHLDITAGSDYHGPGMKKDVEIGTYRTRIHPGVIRF